MASTSQESTSPEDEEGRYEARADMVAYIWEILRRIEAHGISDNIVQNFEEELRETLVADPYQSVSYWIVWDVAMHITAGQDGILERSYPGGARHNGHPQLKALVLLLQHLCRGNRRVREMMSYHLRRSLTAAYGLWSFPSTY